MALSHSNIVKAIVKHINSTCTQKHGIRSTELDEVDYFRNVGSVISANGGSSEDIRDRIKTANQGFGTLKAVWNSSLITRRTELKIYNSNMKSTLIYGCETWNITAADIHHIFINRLVAILRIYWSDTISNINLWANTNLIAIRLEIAKRKYRWFSRKATQLKISSNLEFCR